MTLLKVTGNNNGIPFEGYISSDQISMVFESGNGTSIKLKDGSTYDLECSMELAEIAMRSGTIIPAEIGYKILTFSPRDGRDSRKPYFEEPVIAWSISAGFPPLAICEYSINHEDWMKNSTILRPDGSVSDQLTSTLYPNIANWLEDMWEDHQAKAVSK